MRARLDAETSGESLPAEASTAREEDARLVAALLERDLTAAAQLYDRYAANVRGMAHRLLGADTELDDIVQDVFVAAITSIQRLRDPSMLKSWLLGIAVGKVRDSLRARWRRRWLSFLPNDELPDHAGAENEAQSDVAREIKALLNQLPPEERLALLLHRLEGLSLEEAATASNMTVSTFKRRLTRAETKFVQRAHRRPALAEWLRGRRTP
jgi:RNA polymerase sigma-70 factor (ECF subfamily)